MNSARESSGASPPDPPSGSGGTLVAGSLGIGLVGPMSNYATPPQWVERVTYRDTQEMHQFADRWRDEHRGQWFCTPKLSGFCLLMKRAVYDRIGGLDERFGLGFFDRTTSPNGRDRVGFELAVAHDLFVHHFGSRTFAGQEIDTERLLDENAGRFAEKWRTSATPTGDGLPFIRGRLIRNLRRNGIGRCILKEKRISRKAAKPQRTQVGSCRVGTETRQAMLEQTIQLRNAGVSAPILIPPLRLCGFA